VYILAELLAAHGVAALLGSVTFPPIPLPDLLVRSPSSDSKLTVKQAYNFLRQNDVPVSWAAAIWKICIPPSHSFIFWRLAHGKMPTNENLRSCGCVMASIFNLCLQSDETS